MDAEAQQGGAVAAAETEATAAGKDEGDADAEMVSRAQRLISKINACQEDPDPRHFHALSSMLEMQQERYNKECANSSFSESRSTHAIGKLENVLHENDEFVLSLSTKYLAEGGYSVGVRAAAARLLLSGASTWMIFDDTVTENAKNWLVEDNLSDCLVRDEVSRDRPSDSEMLKTYAAGILAMCLTTGGDLVEDVLSAGLSAKLMRYLRLRVLGDSNLAQKDANVQTGRHGSTTSSVRGREDSRSRLRHSSETARLDGTCSGNENSACDLRFRRDPTRRDDTSVLLGGELYRDDMPSSRSELIDSAFQVVSSFDSVNGDMELAGAQLQSKDIQDLKSKQAERHGIGGSTHCEIMDENTRNDTPRSHTRGFPRYREKGGSSEGPPSESNFTNAEDMEGKTGAQLVVSARDGHHTSISDAYDDRISCIIGTRDISDLVKKAVEAAEAEARSADAPTEAVKAAGDAAADLVKTSALEVWKNSNSVEAAVLAASEAVSTVVNASSTSEMLRLTAVNENVAKAIETKAEEDSGDFFILDCESLARLREKYSIECLEILGEYVEALGPVLHEKGVDVCLALLQRSSKLEASNNLALLPKVLKLICALAAHRKFAALFVDRGGMQKLLSVERVPDTFLGISSCLFTIGSLQGIMERVCALPTSVVYQVVELALQLLECSQDQARKNAAIFFTSAFVFRAILDSFDEQEGLQKMLNLLHGAASVRSGGNSGTLGLSNTTFPNERSPSDVLTAAEKQLAYQTCFALRQYFRAHLILLLDSLRPNKASRNIVRSTSIARAVYKPLDISNEAMDSVFLQLQRDRKIGPAVVRVHWAAVDKFLASNGHITMLELCQAPAIERYLHDLAQYALGVLHIVTLVPYSRKLIVNAALSNDRSGMAIILDAANAAGGFVDPEVICPALDVLVNLVCPPPSISIKPAAASTENRERIGERNIIDRNVSVPMRADLRDRNGEPLERGAAAAPGVGSSGSAQTGVPSVSSGLVGDRRISLGPGAGCAGLAAQLEQGYRQAREAVRSNNGIKVLLHLLHPRMVTPPGALDHIRSLACRVLLGLARDDAIAHILTKLQVGKKLSELIRDPGGQTSGPEQDRWQSELARVAIELIAVVTNSGRASTLVATDAAAPTLRRIERAAIAAATPITYHSRELLLLILEHLQVSGLSETAAMLQKEASLTPLPFLCAPQPQLHQTCLQETAYMPFQWPSGRSSCGFLANVPKVAKQEEVEQKCFSGSRKKKLLCSASFGRNLLLSQPSSIDRASDSLKRLPANMDCPLTPNQPSCKSSAEVDRSHNRTPILLPMKRKSTDCKDSAPQAKRFATAEIVPSPLFQTPVAPRRNTMPTESLGLPQLNSRDQNRVLLVDNPDYIHSNGTPRSFLTPGPSFDPQLGFPERMTLDSLVVHYLKYQHRQCPAPITTLPPLSLLHPHMCPEPSHKLDAPANITARVSSREFRKIYGGVRAHRRDRQFVYSRFKQWRTCRDDASPSPLTCITFLGDTSRFATGSKSGELKIFDLNSGQVLESNSSHQSLVTSIQSTMYNESQVVLSSSLHDVKLWDASLVSAGPSHTFEGCKSARFSHSGTMFAALSTDASHNQILLYDINKYDVEQNFLDNSNVNGQSRVHVQSLIHFSPSDTMLLWNGTLWDRRSSTPIHNFDQFSDYGGGGFHPSGNERWMDSNGAPVLDQPGGRPNENINQQMGADVGDFLARSGRITDPVGGLEGEIDAAVDEILSSSSKSKSQSKDDSGDDDDDDVGRAGPGGGGESNSGGSGGSGRGPQATRLEEGLQAGREYMERQRNTHGQFVPSPSPGPTDYEYGRGQHPTDSYMEDLTSSVGSLSFMDIDNPYRGGAQSSLGGYGSSHDERSFGVFPEYFQAPPPGPPPPPPQYAPPAYSYGYSGYGGYSSGDNYQSSQLEQSQGSFFGGDSYGFFPDYYTAVPPPPQRSSPTPSSSSRGSQGSGSQQPRRATRDTGSSAAYPRLGMLIGIDDHQYRQYVMDYKAMYSYMTWENYCKFIESAMRYEGQQGRVGGIQIHHETPVSDQNMSPGQVVINSEVWDLRKFKLLRSVPSLDQTFINFSAGGDVIYATLRRNLDELKSAVNIRRLRHPLFAAFRTIDAVNYSDIATIPVDRCVLDFATEPTDSFVGVVTMDDHDEPLSSARVYEIGRRRPTDDDSDPDDGADTEEDEEDEDDDSEDVGQLLGSDLDVDGDSDEADDESNDDDGDSGDDPDDDVEFTIDEVDLDGQEMLELGMDGEDDESDLLESMSDDEGVFAEDFGF